MVSYNAYVSYKRDTRNLLYWMIRASNSIIKGNFGLEDDPSQPALNTTGQTTVPGLVAMAELIGKHMSPIPSAILRLLDSVISARSAFHDEFQRLAAAKPDPELEKSNATHRYFIDALTRAFKALGGEAWASREQAGDSDNVDDPEDVIFSNQFAALKLETAADDDASDDGASDNEAGPSTGANAAPRRGQRKPGKGGKKGKKGKKPAKKQQKPGPAKGADLEDVPLESYRIIEDEEGIMTDYLLAVYSIMKEWSSLRSYLLGIWREVAYEGLNSAVAGVLSNIAVAMVRQTELAIFVDFPGHDSYETVMQTMTRGNVEKAQGMFSVALYHLAPGGGAAHQVRETNIDIKEHFLINAYRDLLDFVSDYQKTRSGKPTKAMLAQIRDWDPNLDLQRASRDERLKWRRSYTINWLYDLVNVFSGVVVQRIRLKGERHVLENVDWSPLGPWGQHRNIYGINDFAAFVTSLAMQREGTDVRKKILPQHVFQLQCIVDAFTVSRGWSFHVLQGHVVQPPARDFRPRRDVDMFLDRHNERDGSGLPRSVDVLKAVLKRDGERIGNPQRYDQYTDLIQEIRLDFRDWLGETKYKYGLNAIPPSRFSNTNANGLWEYSPFLCGVGLMEGLEIMYRASMMLWEGLPDPTLLVHLHNMLVQKGYLKKPVELFENLQNLLKDAIFVDGKVPTEDFNMALYDRVMKQASPADRRRFASKLPDIHAVLDVSANRSFKRKSNLLLYREAGWDLSRIPDHDLQPHSMLGMLRITQTKQVVDPATGKKRLADTDLLRRFKAIAPGMRDDEDVMMMAAQLRTQLSLARGLREGDAAQMQSMLESIATRSGNKLFSDAEFKKKHGHGRPHAHMSPEEMLSCVKLDVYNDVCSDSEPLSGINYLYITSICVMILMQMENRLKDLRHPVYIDAYEKRGEWSKTKRFGLVAMAIRDQDEECLRVMAEVFHEGRASLLDHVYWGKLVPASDALGGASGLSGNAIPEDVGCTVILPNYLEPWETLHHELDRPKNTPYPRLLSNKPVARLAQSVERETLIKRSPSQGCTQVPRGRTRRLSRTYTGRTYGKNVSKSEFHHRPTGTRGFRLGDAF
ncbi:hypothetical protein ACRALDRAFT_1082332 [Sodiomyces alcalophilus JCM 7366]|uniref:uncharacterized protein n=1 Tax=Sodiomyces alcalophilus JCM 7366 TaxID=591952 RepID=UPI0039B39B2C